jgi:hypothetical protein
MKRRMVKKAALLTRPTPAATSPARPEFPRQPLCPGTRLFPRSVCNIREARELVGCSGLFGLSDLSGFLVDKTNQMNLPLLIGLSSLTS